MDVFCIKSQKAIDCHDNELSGDIVLEKQAGSHNCPQSASCQKATLRGSFVQSLVRCHGCHQGKTWRRRLHAGTY